MVKMECETVLGDITNKLTEDGKRAVERIEERVSLIRINVVKSSYLNYHEEWSHGNSHIQSNSVICLEGKCGEVLEKLDEIIERDM